jgi:thymidylate kinase
MPKQKRGRSTVLEGLDGIGKGLVQRTILEFEKNRGKIISTTDYLGSLRDFETLFRKNENLANASSGEYILECCEPTRVGIGQVIRQEIIANNKRKYSSETKIQAYSIDRLVLMKMCIIPFLENNQDVVESRNFASTLCYQSLEALEEGSSIEDVRNRILEHPGSKIELEYAPDLLIISTINDVSELIKRLQKREKKDKCEFENLNFQRKLKPFYEDPWIKELFEKHGTRVAYLDAGISEEATKKQAVEIYLDFYDEGIIQERYKYS